ncbi:Kinetochore protein mis14 [Penicillium rolfsii]|nr:Kinetochore protein mis14 [Penicillium rolfsii]
MAAPHYRKVELQSPADFTYLYANTVALSRQKLDLNLPPSATNDDKPDPMRERVRELVDEYITRTFTTASSSISINGLDSSSPAFPFPAAFTAPETVEYEPFDSELASRVSTLYAQLESLTTTVAQLRREAPRKAAKAYAAQLAGLIEEESKEDDEAGLENEDEETQDRTGKNVDADVDAMDVDTPSGSTQHRRSRYTRNRPNPAWTLDISLGTDEEAERWRNGDMAEVYENALRTLQRLQGEGDTGAGKEAGSEGGALATTVGKAERAGRAAEVVENM